ncbi:MAG: hypothetical protein HY663_06355 [Chloroflexi bacterium]|nr:hypothetical protein [Chloroflexota bacterium]
MAILNIELDDRLIDGIKRLAARHYGDSGDASIGCVVGTALEMRLLWLELVKGGGNEINEPVVNWEFSDIQPTEQFPTEIRNFLFGR